MRKPTIHNIPLLLSQSNRMTTLQIFSLLLRVFEIETTQTHTSSVNSSCTRPVRVRTYVSVDLEAVASELDIPGAYYVRSLKRR